MQKEELSSRNAGAVLVFLALGSNMILNFTDGVGQDTWIALLLSYACMLPVFLIYSRLLKLMPGKDIFEMAEASLGRIAGKFLNGLFALFCLLVAAVTLHNYAEFIHLTSLYNTPVIATMALMLLVCLYLAKSGVETLGKWCLIIFITVAAVSVLLDVLSLQYFKAGNLMPVMDRSPAEIGAATAKLLPTVLGDCVVALALMAGFRKGSGSYKTFFAWGAAAIAILTLNFLRACGTLGVNSIATVYAPAYKFVGQIKTGSVLDRVESLAVIVFIQVGISKISACYIAAGRGTARIFNMKAYKPLVLPIGLAIIAVSAVIFRNVYQMLDFMEIYYVIAAPFQLLIPLLIWIAAEIRAFSARHGAGKREVIAE